ncbi:MGMT family protein [Arthrobacter sp. H14-L1]|uniref:MGMT family protein n=1 Tax=Arthrobacter sp. H14-L1 TaxID=2996697 RepID=UPI00226EA95C|nr:MGMT family protein [Arthrobacter sp. H14-L1]MCY0903496.1 MGMT family protein [Arthrobacter sp. H14-L1]
MRAQYIDAVLEVVDLIPVGAVLAYGDIAVLLNDGGPRQVGAVMSRYGSAVAWWRVIRAGGQPPACHDARALKHYRQEGTALRPARTPGDQETWRVDIAAARWQPTDQEFVLLDRIRDGLTARTAAAADTPGATMSAPHDGVVS